MKADSGGRTDARFIEFRVRSLEHWMTLSVGHWTNTQSWGELAKLHFCPCFVLNWRAKIKFLTQDRWFFAVGWTGQGRDHRTCKIWAFSVQDMILSSLKDMYSSKRTTKTFFRVNIVFICFLSHHCLQYPPPLLWSFSWTIFSQLVPIYHHGSSFRLAFSLFVLALFDVLFVVLVVALVILNYYQWCPSHFTTDLTFATLGQCLTGTDLHFFSFFVSFLSLLNNMLRRAKIDLFPLPFVHSYLKERKSFWFYKALVYL